MLQPSADVVFRRLGQTAVLVHLGTSQIFELNDTGARIWELVATGLDDDAVIAGLCAEFEVDEAVAREEYRLIVAELTARQLLESR